MKTIKAANAIINQLTSNNEKELPDAFLRRCFFPYIASRIANTMQRIVDCIFPEIKKELYPKRWTSLDVPRCLV